MKIEIPQGNSDLYAVATVSTFFFLLVLLLPDLSFLRIVLGIPFLVFFPGYMLTSLLYPWKNETDEEIEEEVSEGPTKKSDKKIGDNKKNEPSAIDKVKDKLKGKKIDGPTRLALSFAFSLAVTPLVAFTMNELYRVNDQIFGIRMLPMLITQYFVIMVFGLFAFARRNRVPKAERFTAGITIGPLFDDTITDKVITSVLIILILISAGVGVYLYKYYHENEKYTEFYILGPERKIANYPDLFLEDENKTIFIGVNNHEFERLNYTISIFLKKGLPLERVDSLDHLDIQPEKAYTYDLSISHKEEFFQRMVFSIPNPGAYELGFDLLRNGEVYRSLLLHIKVFEPDDIIRFDNGTRILYLAGIDGAPFNYEDHINVFDSPIGFEITSINKNMTNSAMNISTYIGTTERWINIFPYGNLTTMDNRTGAFSVSDVPSGSVVKIPFTMILPSGDWRLTISVREEDRYFIFEIDFIISG